MKATINKPMDRKAAKAQFSNAAGTTAGKSRFARGGIQRVGKPQVPRLWVPQFVNAHDLISGPLPGGSYDRHVGKVFFANEELYIEDRYSESASDYANRWIFANDATFANDERFVETYFSEPLTNYAVGFRDPNNIEATCSFFAPPVPVGRRFEWKAAVNSEEFLSELVDDQRAIGSDFKSVKYTGTDVTDKTLNRGLTIIVDLDNVTGTNWQNQKVAKLLRRLWRNRLRRALAAIGSAAVQTPYTWDLAAGVNPDQDVRNELIAAANISGIRPNRVGYGDSALNFRMGSFGAQNNPAGYIGYMADPMQSLASALMVDKCIVSKERYQSAAAAKSEIVGNSVFAFFAEDGVDTEDPSNIKCFISSFDSEQGGGLVRVYVQQLSAKLVAVTVEMYEKIVVPYSGGVRQLVITGP